MEVEKFRATTGRTGGVLTLLIAGSILGMGLVEVDRGFPPWVIAVSALLCVLSWASALRPALRVERAMLVMTNMFETVRIPLAAIEGVEVRHLLSVQTADHAYLSSVIGRKARPVVLGGRGRRALSEAPSTPAPTLAPTHADFVEQRLRGLADDARRVATSRPGSSEELALAAGVRRDLAWVPILLVGLATVAVVLSVAL